MESDHVGAPTRTRRGSLSFLGRVLINAQIESATSGRDGGVPREVSSGSERWPLVLLRGTFLLRFQCQYSADEKPLLCHGLPWDGTLTEKSATASLRETRSR